MGPVYCGIDVAAARGHHLCVLRPEGDSYGAVFYDAGPRAAVLSEVLALEPTVVAIDAPQGLRQNLLADVHHDRRTALGIKAGVHGRSRVCDALLTKRRLFLYQVPDALDEAKEWMREGFEFFATLQASGYRLLVPEVNSSGVGGGPMPGEGPWLIETFPDAGFCTLCGERPPKKSTVAGVEARIAALEGAGVRDSDIRLRTHDELDACVAALTAALAAVGRAAWLGDPGEGVMVLPVSEAELRDSYELAPTRAPARRRLPDHAHG